MSGIAEAIERSPALKVYFVNLMWQPGETINFTARSTWRLFMSMPGAN